MAVVNGNCVSLTRYLKYRLIASRDEDGMVLLSRDFDNLAGVVEVFDEPFRTLEILARRLPAPHVLWLGLFAGGRGLGTGARIRALGNS